MQTQNSPIPTIDNDVSQVVEMSGFSIFPCFADAMSTRRNQTVALEAPGKEPIHEVGCPARNIPDRKKTLKHLNRHRRAKGIRSLRRFDLNFTPPLALLWVKLFVPGAWSSQWGGQCVRTSALPERRAQMPAKQVFYLCDMDLMTFAATVCELECAFLQSTLSVVKVFLHLCVLLTNPFCSVHSIPLHVSF